MENTRDNYLEFQPNIKIKAGIYVSLPAPYVNTQIKGVKSTELCYLCAPPVKRRFINKQTKPAHRCGNKQTPG